MKKTLKNRLAYISARIDEFRENGLWYGEPISLDGSMASAPGRDGVVRVRDVSSFPDEYIKILQCLGVGELCSAPRKYESCYIFTLDLPFKWSDSDLGLWSIGDANEICGDVPQYGAGNVWFVGHEGNLSHSGYNLTDPDQPFFTTHEYVFDGLLDFIEQSIVSFDPDYKRICKELHIHCH